MIKLIVYSVLFVGFIASTSYGDVGNSQKFVNDLAKCQMLVRHVQDDVVDTNTRQTLTDFEGYIEHNIVTPRLEKISDGDAAAYDVLRAEVETYKGLVGASYKQQNNQISASLRALDTLETCAQRAKLPQNMSDEVTEALQKIKSDIPAS